MKRGHDKKNCPQRRQEIETKEKLLDVDDVRDEAPFEDKVAIDYDPIEDFGFESKVESMDKEHLEECP